MARWRSTWPDHEGRGLLDDDPLDLVEGDPVRPAVVELGGPRARVRGHALRLLELTAVREVGGDAGRAPGVVADRGEDAGLSRSPPDHLPGVHPIEPLFG